MKFEYKTENAADWMECTATKEGDLFKATLKGLTPATTYSYRLSILKQRIIIPVIQKCLPQRLQKLY